MSALETFTFPETGGELRGVAVDGKPWFVGRDAALALGQTNPTRAIREHVPAAHRRETDSVSPADLGLQPQTVLISEAGLYRLIMRSNTDAAERFQEWVTAEVLPTIRREGGYISPTATEDQLDAITRRARGQMEVLRLADGLISHDWLEARARHVAARALGEEPEVDPARRPLTCGEYLEEKGVTGSGHRSLAPTFGKTVKRLYRQRHGVDPPQSDRFVDGALRKVAAYTEADRDLMDAALTLMGVS